MARMQNKGRNDKFRLLKKLLEFFSSLFQVPTDEREKSQLMRKISANLKKSEKYFRVIDQMAMPALPEAIYAICKVLNSARQPFERYEKHGWLAAHIIEHFLPIEFLAIVEKLQADNIIERRNQSGDISIIIEEVKSDISHFTTEFESLDIESINASYAASSALMTLIRFPYYFFLKKFDPNIKEDDFTHVPHFRAIEAKYIIDDLIDFIEALYSLNENVDWDRLLKLLNEGVARELISASAWRKILLYRKNMIESQTLEHIVQYVTKNIHWRASHYKIDENIVKDYIFRITQNAELTIRVMTAESEKKKIAEKLTALFGETSIYQNKNYSDIFSESQIKKRCKNHDFSRPLNYAQTFYNGIFQERICPLIEPLLAHGRWTMDFQKQRLTTAYNEIGDVSRQLIDFDNDLSGEGITGIKIKLLIRQLPDDPTSLNVLDETLRIVNVKAKTIIDGVIRNFLQLDACFKVFTDAIDADCQTPILNLKEIPVKSKLPNDRLFVEIRNAIAGIIDLLNLCMKSIVPDGARR